VDCTIGHFPTSTVRKFVEYRLWTVLSSFSKLCTVMNFFDDRNLTVEFKISPSSTVEKFVGYRLWTVLSSFPQLYTVMEFCGDRNLTVDLKFFLPLQLENLLDIDCGLYYQAFPSSIQLWNFVAIEI